MKNINVDLTDSTSVSISGALFTEAERDSEVEFAFKYAVDRVNKDHFLLPNTTLVTDIQYVSASDSFHASKKGELRSIPLFFLPLQQQIRYLRSCCTDPWNDMLLSSKISLIPTFPVSVFLELLLELLVATLFACSTRRVSMVSPSYSHYPSSHHPSNEKEDKTE